MSEWIQGQLGVDAGNLYPSVRSGLEGAVLMAIASAQGRPLSDLLAASMSKFVRQHHPVHMATHAGCSPSAWQNLSCFMQALLAQASMRCS